MGRGWHQNYFSSIIQIKKAILVDAYEYYVYSICRQWDAYKYFCEYELFTGGVINDHTPLTFSRNKKQKKTVIKIFHPQCLPKRIEKYKELHMVAHKNGNTKKK